MNLICACPFYKSEKCFKKEALIHFSVFSPPPDDKLAEYIKFAEEVIAEDACAVTGYMSESVRIALVKKQFELWNKPTAANHQTFGG